MALADGYVNKDSDIDQVGELGAARVSPVQDDDRGWLSDLGLSRHRIRAVGSGPCREVERMPRRRSAPDQRLERLAAQPSPIDRGSCSLPSVERVPFGIGDLGSKEIVAGHDHRIQLCGHQGGQR